MKRKWWGLLAVMLLLTASLARAGDFKWEKIPEEKLDSVMSQMYGFGYNPSGTYGADIKSSGTKVFGQHPFNFVAYSTTQNGKPDRLVLDLNRNGDASDDGTFELEDGKMLSFDMPIESSKNKKSIAAVLKLIHAEASFINFEIKPAEWLKGEIEIDGAKIPAIIIDTDLNGVIAGGDSPDVLIGDMDGDGQFLNEGQIPIYGCYSHLSKPMLLGAKLWTPDFNSNGENGPALALKPYENPKGKIQIQADEWDDAWKSGPIMTMLVTKSLPIIGKPIQVNAGVCDATTAFEVPAAYYDQMIIYVSKIEDGKPRGVVLFEPKKTIAKQVEPDKTLTLKLGKPKEFSLLVRQNGSKLSVDKGEVSGGDVAYAQFVILDENGGFEMAPPPKAKIFHLKDGEKKQIAEGVMEYG
ncbi:MAG: hypothetical protein ACOC54_02435 [Candidatus Sumerlaeota bacterium]